MHRRKGTAQYGEAEADGRRPLLEDANSSDDEDIINDGVDGGDFGNARMPNASTAVNFIRLKTDDGIDESQWSINKPQTPWKTIAFASLLFVVGGGCMLLATLIAFGVMHETYDDRMWPALLLGSLMFIPGAYYIGVTVFAWLGLFGCTCDQIPQFNT